MSNLLVIDEIENSIWIKEIFEDMEHNITVVPPAAAIELLAGDCCKFPDLVIISENQREQDGHQICRMIRGILESDSIYIPILLRVLDKTYSEDIYKKAQEAGADDIFTDAADGVLESKIRSLLRIRRLNDQLMEKMKVIQAANEIFHEQLKIARQVQRSFVHEADLCFQNIQFSSRYLPAFEIGGDFYEIMKLNDNMVAVVMGDVQGHGISAALLTAMLSLIIKQLVPKYINPSQFMYHMNNEFFEVFSNSRDGVPVYTSMFYALIDTGRKKIYYSNAGLVLPIFIDAARSRAYELDITGTPVGMMPKSQYDQGIREYSDGDMILFYTDGLSDNMFRHNPGEFYRLVTGMLSDASAGVPLDTIIDSLIEVFANYEDGTDKSRLDDISLILCRM